MKATVPFTSRTREVAGYFLGAIGLCIMVVLFYDWIPQVHALSKNIDVESTPASVVVWALVAMMFLITGFLLIPSSNQQTK